MGVVGCVSDAFWGRFEASMGVLVCAFVFLVPGGASEGVGGCLFLVGGGWGDPVGGDMGLAYAAGLG